MTMRWAKVSFNGIDVTRFISGTFDIDYRTDAYLEQQVRDAVEEAFEDAECCMCDQLAVATATLLPCGHEGQYCTVHRKAVQRARAWHLKAGQSKSCGICHTPIEAVAWGRL